MSDAAVLIISLVGAGILIAGSAALLVVLFRKGKMERPEYGRLGRNDGTNHNNSSIM